MSDAPAYRFAPRREPGTLGLARSQVLTLCTGVVLALIAVLAAHQPIVGLGCIGLGAAIAFTPIGGRPLVAWLAPLAARCVTRRGATAPLDQHELRIGRGLERPRRPEPVRWHLPGIGRCSIRPVMTNCGAIGVADVSGAHRAASLTFSLSGPRFGLTDPDEQARALNSWGQLLGALAREARELQRLQLTERVAPDDLGQQWRFLERVGATADPGARAVYRSELASLAGQAVRHEVLLTVTLGRTRRNGQAVASECVRLCDLLDSAGFTARPLSATELTLQLRSILDPESAGLLDNFVESARIDGTLDADLHAPRSWRAGWGTVRTDSGWHACFEASGLPRLPVGPEWAWPLVLAEAPVARRTLALHLELARPDLALRRAERAVMSQESDEAMRARWGFRSGARELQAHDAALAREGELANGFADARFALIVTVSATSEEELAASCRALISQGAQSHVELRRLYGRQSEALVATLPLGIVRFAGGWR